MALLAAGAAWAQQAVTVQSGTTIRDVLAAQQGKAVTVHLRGGEELSGKLATVGESTAHLSGLTGRDLYDAAMRLDGIDAVIVRAR